MSGKTKTEQKRSGDRGERLTAWYLRLRGYRIIERNWRSHHKEVDIIASRGRVIAFVEVKTRAASAVVPPAYSVTAQKQANVIAAAKASALLHDVGGRSVRFDVAEVVGGKVNYIKNAYHG